MGVRRWRLLPVLFLTLASLLACGASDQGSNPDPDQVDSVEVPQLGACRSLTPEDVEQPSNASKTVDCSAAHTAETFAVGELPAKYHDADWNSPELGTYAYRTCGAKFQRFLGADASMVMRAMVSWAWFRPSLKAWEKGARWYRCDIVGGGDQSSSYVDLPKTAKGLLAQRDTDKWMVCAVGPTVAGSKKVPCAAEHQWRAVTSIKLGEPQDPYPGDKLVQVRTRDYCSDSVGAWLGYPVDYDFAYTWFHQAEWEAGNRLSVCWAKTPQ
jgi:hypothetical protein